MNRFIIKTVGMFLLFISVLPAAAQDGVYGSAGSRVIFSEDEEVSQHYYKPFAKLGWSGDLIDISASYYRWISYSITDALYNTKEININQPGADITVFAGDIFSISGGYSYMGGSSSYIAHRYTGEILLDFERIDISADSSLKKVEYDFNGTIKNSYVTAGGEMSFDITESFSWDIGYLHEYTDYKTYGYTYVKNSGRIGLVAAPVANLYLLGGLTGGRDSDSVNTAAFDAGFTLKLFEHLKLSASYMFTADFISSGSTSTSGGRRGSSTTSSATSTDTEISHTGNISVSLYF